MRNKLVIIVFSGFLLVFGLGYIFNPQREFSEMENHYLSIRPDFTWKSYLKGEFTTDFDSYTADQILGKDWFVKSNVALNRAVGISEINQVFIGKDGYLIQDYQKPGDQLQKNLEYIRAFAEENPDVPMTMLLAPNASEIYPEKLPALAETYSQETVIGQAEEVLSGSAEVVDPTKILKQHKTEAIYYKTDHHWTTLGAYYAYEELCDNLSLEPVPYEQYNQTVLEPFYGSLYSKAPVFDQEADQVNLLTNPSGTYTVEYEEEARSSDTMYDMSYAERKDKYAVFFGGNYPVARIKSNGVNTEKVLIIKDSYANSLVPFLADQYREIHMLDLRYYHESVSEYIRENGIERVIFINNVDFISTDNNFLWL